MSGALASAGSEERHADSAPLGPGVPRPSAERRLPPERRTVRVAFAAFLSCLVILACDTPGPFGRASQTEALACEAWSEALIHADPAIRLEAVRVLGTRGSAAVPLLVEALWDHSPVVREAASAALAGVGGEAVPELVAALQVPGLTHLPRRAAETLGRMGRHAGAAAGTLGRALSSEDTYLRLRAAGALADLGSAAAPAVPALASALDADPAPSVRMSAAVALGSVGGEVARTALEQALQQDAHWMVREQAARALGCVLRGATPGDPAALRSRVLLAGAVAEDSSSQVRRAAFAVLTTGSR